MKSHRETYPEQYSDPLCGKDVQIIHEGKQIAHGKVERVVPSRFGLLVILEGHQQGYIRLPLNAYAFTECVETTTTPKGK